MERTPQEILKDGADTYEKKNADYGSSWKTVGEIMYKMAGEQPITISSPKQWIMVGLYTRRLDKLLRSFNGELRIDPDDLNFESVGDTHGDESVYAAMAASLIRELEANQEHEQPSRSRWKTAAIAFGTVIVLAIAAVVHKDKGEL